MFKSTRITCLILTKFPFAAKHFSFKFGDIVTPSGPEVKNVRADGDIMSPVALENAYVTCHNVQDLLHLRGFTSKPVHIKTKRNKVGMKKIIRKNRG